MKTVQVLGLLGIGLALGLLVGLTVGPKLTATATTTLKVGDCVRELGHETKETISYITNGGAVETEYTRTYNDGSVGPLNRSIYYGSQLTTLVQVPCTQ